MMRLTRLKIERELWGNDKGKLVGEIAFENQDAKVTVILDEDKCYKMLEIVAENVVSNARETANLLVSQMSRPQAEIEEEVQ